jgi:hypothetical protein
VGVRDRRRRARAVFGAVALVAVGSVLVLSSGGSGLAAVDPEPVPFRLIFEGAHDQGFGQENPLRRGAFSAVAPVCPSGAAVDERYVHPNGVLREHTCADGSGSFTAALSPAVAELGGAGAWRILGGTGRYSNLRGQGAFTGEFVSGSPSHEETVSFRTSWTGVVGFDSVAPVISRVHLSTARRAAGTYELHVSFRTRDGGSGGRVHYLVLPSSGSRALPFAEGRVRPGKVAVALKVDVYRPDLPLLVEIRAADPLGNERRVVRSVSVERR